MNKQDFIKNDAQGREALERGKALILQTYPGRQDAVDEAWEQWSFPSVYLNVSRQKLIDSMLEIAHKKLQTPASDSAQKKVTLNFDELRSCINGETEQSLIDRLETLCREVKLPQVVVLGKYNHGKSSLLNALAGSNTFKVSDARETTQVTSADHNGIRWIDTPGLDADAIGEDDRKALNTLKTYADVCLFVHSLKAGELDMRELTLLKALADRKLILVITRIDDVAEREQAAILSAIRVQMPQAQIYPVSVHRFKKGIEQKKNLLIESSGFKVLEEIIQLSTQDVSRNRVKERTEIARKLKEAISSIEYSENNQLTSERKKKEDMISAFSGEFSLIKKRINSYFI